LAIQDIEIMAASRSPICRAGVLALALLPGFLVSGCAWERPTGDEPDMSRVVQRPTYPIEGTKPLYLGGYAGAYYGPSGIGR
jgi:hypothetical protein